MSTNIKGFFTTTILIFFIGLIPMYRGTGIFVFFRFILIICLVVQISMLFHSLFIKGAWKEKSNFGTICFSLIISFLFLETGFMFIPQSHGVGGYVLGDQIWMKKYWNPINSFGFRDIEPNDISSAVLFVGDSFTAGNGLKDIKERYWAFLLIPTKR